jgi:hypothetical protein
MPDLSSRHRYSRPAGGCRRAPARYVRSICSPRSGQDTGHLDAREALQLYRVIAQQNRRKREVGDPDWQGIAFSLDPAAYGE